MIKIKNIEIDSFKLLKNTELNLGGKSGIVSLQGINLDNPNFSGNFTRTFYEKYTRGFYRKII